MSKLSLNFPTFGFIVATRAALGVGVGMLLADRIAPERRRKIGLFLVSLGAATTVPAIIAIQRGSTRPIGLVR